jgi:hypothetical protein
MAKTTTIAVERDTVERLRQLGRYGDDMNSIIKRLLGERKT